MKTEKEFILASKSATKYQNLKLQIHVKNNQTSDEICLAYEYQLLLYRYVSWTFVEQRKSWLKKGKGIDYKPTNPLLE